MDSSLLKFKMQVFTAAIALTALGFFVLESHPNTSIILNCGATLLYLKALTINVNSK